jgi:hypothetical protein
MDMRFGFGEQELPVDIDDLPNYRLKNQMEKEIFNLSKPQTLESQT